jgi:hypothetical protein
MHAAVLARGLTQTCSSTSTRTHERARDRFKYLIASSVYNLLSARPCFTYESRINGFNGPPYFLAQTSETERLDRSGATEEDPDRTHTPERNERIDGGGCGRRRALSSSCRILLSSCSAVAHSLGIPVRQNRPR